MKHLATALLLLLACAAPLCAQDEERYDFIRYDSNRLHYDSTSPSLTALFDRWQRVVETGSGNINIVHIGGSHVQAGMMSNTVRCRIMQQWPTLVGSRGMLFPYSAAARCNNPADYRIHCRERMQLNSCVAKEHPLPLGLCGIAVTAADTMTEVQVVMNEPRVDYATSRVVVIGHSDSNVVPCLSIDGRTVFPSYVAAATERYVFNLSAPTDSFAILLPCQPGQQFTLTGLYLGNRQPGFTFSSIGVNGAAVPDYLRCTHFVRDLRMLHPDLVIFGIGINDAVPANFDTAAFRQNYLALIDSVRAANPDCAFLFVTNNDSFRKTGRRRYAVNTNGALAREVFYRLAREVDGAVWDQYEVMGGQKSMDKWRIHKLAQTDRVHFTAAGYRLVGNLLADALLQALDAHSQPTTTR
jgi:lysophospholipase L1-like esterase